MDRVRVRHQNHIGLVDSLPACDGRPIEHDAIGEHVFVHLSHIHRDVMHFALRISEAQVNEFYFIVLDLLHDVTGCSHIQIPVCGRDE